MSLKIGAYTSLPANGLFKFKFVDLMKYYSSTQSGKPCLGKVDPEIWTGC